MTTKRRELINALIADLKVKENVYAIETIKESTEHLNENQYLDFYQAVMKEDSFGNGVKSIMKIAEQFKPIEINHNKSKAEKLIQGVEQMNTALWYEAKDLKRVFEDYVKDYEFENVCDETKAILNNVAPHYNIAELTISIRKYQTGSDAVNAFQKAIEQTNKSNAVQISNPIQNLRIKR